MLKSLTALLIALLSYGPAAHATNKLKSEPCWKLMLADAPLPAQLKGEAHENLRKDIFIGAYAPVNELNQLAWKSNKYGFLSENLDVDYDTFILDWIKGGRDINERDANGRTALMHAAATRYSRMTWALLKLGANVDIKDKDGRTAADISVMLSNYENYRTDLWYIQNFLTYRGHYIAGQVWEHFRNRNFKQLESLFAKGVYVDTFDLGLGKSLLTVAAENNDLEMMRFLLKHGANPNFGNRGIWWNNYPVISASAACHKEAIELLLEHGANLNAIGSNSYDVNPVRHAIWDYAFEANDKYPKLEMLEWWLKKGADPNANLERLSEHQRESLKRFMDDAYEMGATKGRREKVEALLRKYNIHLE